MKNIQDIPEHVFKTSYQNATIGHVLTPPKLALEMLNTLPNDFFLKSGIKIFDPACKNGSFLFQIALKQLDNNWSIKEIESSLYTCDTLNASLNVTESGIKGIIRFPYKNSLIKIDDLFYKYPAIELLYDELIKTITKNKYIKVVEFINNLLLDKKNNWLIVKFEEILIEFIKKYEGLSKIESKLFGEVFTPQNLIEEMLDTLPTDVWSNKDLKWLDPAVGIGNFPAAILNRLMKGLEGIIPDESERRKHILEEMIYMCDISTKNLFLLYQLFDANQEFKLNVFRGDFLSDKFDKHMKNVWKLTNFHLVVCNPPYQKSGEGRAEKLWTKFIAKSSNISKDEYILFVTPNSWLAGSNNIKKGVTGVYKDYFCKYKLIYANIERCNHYFPNIGVRFSYFLLKSEESSSFKTKWNLIDGVYDFDIRNYKFLPPNMNKLQISINNKFFNKGKNYDVIPLTGGDKYRKTGVDEIEGNKNIKTYVRGSNLHKINYAYFDRIVNESVSNIKKVVIPISGAEKFMPFVDIEGIPVCISSYLVKLNKDDTLEGSLSFFNSKLVKFIFQENRSSGFIQVFVAKSIPIMDLSKKWTDDMLYQYFELNQEEINLIEKTITD